MMALPVTRLIVAGVGHASTLTERMRYPKELFTDIRLPSGNCLT